MVENTWVASSDKDWIHIEPTEGTSGDNINIKVTEATSPYDDANGNIVIKTDDETIVKTVKRCLPTITGTTKELSFKVSYDGSLENGVGYCENGASSVDSDGIEITNIVLTTKQYLDKGSLIETTQNLSINDVNIWFIFVDSTKLTYLPANEDVDRDITIKVELKSDATVFNVKQIKQLGIKDSNGKYIESRLKNIGFTDETVEYRDFSIVEKNEKSPSCNGSSKEFHVNGYKVTVYGAKTGLTECNQKVIIDSGHEGEHSDITLSDVTFSVTPTNYNDRFDEHVLHYQTNETRTTDRQLTIRAVLNEDNSVNDSTIFTVIAGNECGSDLYIVFKSDKDSIDYKGGTVKFTYYLSESEDGEESTAIKDTNINNCLNFLHPQGVTTGNSSYENGVFKVDANFSQISVDYKLWEFSATCETAVNSPQKIKISQIKSIIPNCDYFDLRFVFDKNDGEQIDSLVVLSADNVLESCSSQSSQSKDTTKMPIGWWGAGGHYLYKCGNTNDYYLIHSGDNRCPGFEQVLFCLKNILREKKSGKLYIDVYTIWFNKGNGDGKVNIEYRQYSGTPEGTFDSEIEKTIGDCSEYGSEYYIFEPKEGVENVTALPSDENIFTMVDNTYAITREKQLMKAEGTVSHLVPFFHPDTLSSTEIYSHVLTLTYNIDEGYSSLKTYSANGLDASTFKTGHTVTLLCNGNPVITNEDKNQYYYNSDDAASFNLTIKQPQVSFNNMLKNCQLYFDDNESVKSLLENNFDYSFTITVSDYVTTYTAFYKRDGSFSGNIPDNLITDIDVTGDTNGITFKFKLKQNAGRKWYVSITYRAVSDILYSADTAYEFNFMVRRYEQ